MNRIVWSRCCSARATSTASSGSSDPSAARSVDRALRFNGRSQIDLLLMIDDSGSMTPKQARFRDEILQLLQKTS